MIRDIVKDIDKLSVKCDIVERKDPEVNTIIKDLIDTANYYAPECVGLAANQIGYNKNIIIVRNKLNKWIPMVNPIIIAVHGRKIVSRESCMSLEGEREVKRYTCISVSYMTSKMKNIIIKLIGSEAIIAQHEVDHTKGILI